MRARKLLAVAGFLFLASSAAAAQESPTDCLGVDFNVDHPIGIAKIIADQPQVHFVKNASDVPACPSADTACSAPAYLVPGDLVLIGKTHGAYTCVSYESAAAPKPAWTNGWLPSASMTPVMPTPSPSRAAWIGRWTHASGNITIRSGGGGKLTIKGEGFYAAAQNVHTGVIAATAKPSGSLLQFADDGSVPFDKASDDKGSCLVRMQLIAKLLVVEDNGACGGIMVTFTGFYRRK